MSCTQRQRGGAAERGEAHVGGRGAVGWRGGGGVVDKVGGGSGRLGPVVAQLACGQLGRSPGGFFSFLFFVLFSVFFLFIFLSVLFNLKYLCIL